MNKAPVFIDRQLRIYSKTKQVT